MPEDEGHGEIRWREGDTLKNILDEMKVRAYLAFGARQEISDSLEHPYDNIFHVDGIFLQLRFALELFVLAMLANRSQDEQTDLGKIFSKAWQPTEIIRSLSQLHPDFWPKPIQVDLVDKKTLRADYRPASFLPSDLRRLHGKLGKRLHARRTWDKSYQLAELDETLEEFQRFIDYSDCLAFANRFSTTDIIHVDWEKKGPTTALRLRAVMEPSGIMR